MRKPLTYRAAFDLAAEVISVDREFMYLDGAARRAALSATANASPEAQISALTSSLERDRIRDPLSDPCDEMWAA